MTQAKLIPQGAGEVVGDSPDRRVEILSDADSLHATWSRFGPGREGADLHVHHHHTDLFYVLEGELSLRLGMEDRAVRLPAGTLARLPRLVTHGFRNAGESEVSYLNFHAPGQGFADFMRALRAGHTLPYDQHPPPSDGGRPSGEAAVGRPDVIVDEEHLYLALLVDVEDIAVAEIRADRLPPGPPQVNRDHLRSIYVLEGRVTVTAGDDDLEANAGSWVQVPQGVLHSVAMRDGRTRFLDIHTPGSRFGDHVRALHRRRTAGDSGAAGE